MNNKAFTLVELLIVLMLISIVFAIIFIPITFSHNNFNLQNEKTNITSELRSIMSLITKDIRKSDTISIDNNTIILDSGKYFIIDEKLYKDDKIISKEPVEMIVVVKEDSVLIDLIIYDSKGKENILSSVTNIR